MGTPLNMAPELIKGENEHSKSDLWSLGVILYQLLTGQYPFFALSLSELYNNIKQNSG